jgi:hypothetical protein
MDMKHDQHDKPEKPDALRAEEPAADQEGIDPEDAERLRDIGYQPSVNQVRHEPMPASTHAERDQEAVRRNEEAAAASAKAQQRKDTPEDS